MLTFSGRALPRVFSIPRLTPSAAVATTGTTSSSSGDRATTKMRVRQASAFRQSCWATSPTSFWERSWTLLKLEIRTQMRRGVIVAAASAYAIASATAADLPAYIDNAVAKAKARLAENELRAHSLLQNAHLPEARRDAQAFLHLDYAREAQALQSLTELVGKGGEKEELSKALATLREEEKLATNRMPAASGADAAASAAADSRVPERNMAIRGPVNFYRPEYGRWWLADKTGDEHFDSKIPLARRGHYVMYEALN